MRNQHSAVLALCLFASVQIVHAAAPEEKTIEAVLTTQVKAWNAADIPRFMEYYWKSDKLTFSSGGTTRRGWQATLDSYKKRYPTPAKMGKLAFDGLEFTMLGTDAALVLGKWHLERKEDANLGGNFSLVFRKLNGKWLIIHDHSSALSPSTPAPKTDKTQ